jgi:hypothetical protein
LDHIRIDGKAEIGDHIEALDKFEPPLGILVMAVSPVIGDRVGLWRRFHLLSLEYAQ